MTASLRALLAGILDYAGLFPPAALDMPAAVEEYARHRGQPEAWMLSHFICPAGRLSEFEAAARRHLGGGRTPWTLSLLSRGGHDVGGFRSVLTEDASRGADLQSRLRGRVEIRQMEIPAPAAVLDEAGPGSLVGEMIESIGSALPRLLPGLAQVFLEIPVPDDAEERLEPLFAAIAARRDRGAGILVGVKIRTGGVTAEAFPTPAQVAAFLTAAREAGLAFKATAGLHHPLRHFAPSVETRMHGFLNVFVGAALLRAGQVDGGELVALLEEEDAGAFRFSETDIAWRGRVLPLEEIAASRGAFAISYGSCSFAEPVEDLRDLDLL